MAFYENIFIVRPNLLATQVQELIENYTAVIGERGGSVTRTEYWGLKKMAYEIKKNNHGHYVALNIDAPHAAVQEMERQMYINEDVLRYLTVKVDTLEDGPSVMLRTKHSSGRDYERTPGRDYAGRDYERAPRDTADIEDVKSSDEITE